jgi:hypothetical protein
MESSDVTAYVWYGKYQDDGKWFEFDGSPQNIADFILTHSDMNCIVEFNDDTSLEYDSKLGIVNGQDLKIFEEIEPLMTSILIGETDPARVWVRTENEDGEIVESADDPTMTPHDRYQDLRNPALDKEKSIDGQYIQLSKEIDAFYHSSVMKEMPQHNPEFTRQDMAMSTMADLTLQNGDGTKGYLTRIATHPEENSEDSIVKANDFLDRIKDLEADRLEADQLSIERTEEHVRTKQHVHVLKE